MKRFISLVIGMTLVLGLLYAAAEGAGWTDASAVDELFERARDTAAGRWLVAAAVAGLLAGDLVLPVPSSVVMTLSGVFLGTVPGTAVSLAGSMASALIGFAVCRRFGQAAFSRFVGEADIGRVERLLARYGAWAILLSRSVPMLTEIMSCVAGLSRFPFRRFVALALAGTAPLCAVYAWAGSRGSTASGVPWAVLLAFVLPALGFAALQIGRRARECRRGPG